MSHVPYYGPDDDFGVPSNMLGCTDDTFRAVGRVAAIAAIIELRMSDIVVQWGRDPNDKGRLMDHLVKRFKQTTLPINPRPAPDTQAANMGKFT